MPGASLNWIGDLWGAMPPFIPNGALPYSVNGNKTVQDKTKYMTDFCTSRSTKAKQIAEELN